MSQRFSIPSLVRSLAFGLLFAAASWGFAQDDEDAPPPPKKKEGVQITFLPPPMQGVLSLGIYTADGKLTRVLHREATEKAFVIGLNGLITQWDGKNDKGEQLPAGKYLAKGWMTGDLGVDGVAFYGNDWFKEDGPRFTQALRFQKAEDGSWQVVLQDTAGKEQAVTVAAETSANAKSTVEITLTEGVLSIKQGETQVKAPLDEGEKVLKASVGFGGNVWAIVEKESGREVRSYSPAGEFLRRLAYRESEPVPFDLVASTSTERVLLLERNTGGQRFRILSQPESTAEGSTWKTIDERQILASDRFESVASRLDRARNVNPTPFVKVSSKLNPLLQNARTEVEIQAVPGPDGAVLVTSDGLPLTQITETKGLKWCVLVREGKSLTLFESDGSVVEEFKISKPENLMSFDAGEYTFKR